MSSDNPYRYNIDDDDDENQSIINTSSHPNQNNDTFLSRIFGLNSVYNQMQENYQYYDPEFDSTYNQNQSITEAQDDDLPKQNTSLLNSESDSDLSSSEESYVRPNKPSDEEQQGGSIPLKKIQPKITFQTPQKPTSHKKPTTKPIPQDNNYKGTSRRATIVIPPKERALYLWANITNMDEFLVDVYYYYLGRGLVNIVLTKIVDLLIFIFVLNFTIFLRWGINYDLFFENMKERKHMTLSDLIVSNYLFRKVPFSVKFLLFGFFIYLVLRSVQLYFDCNYKLKEIKNFYHHLLGISDNELMTINWKTIVEKLMSLKNYNSLTSSKPTENHYVNDLSSKVRLNAHDIANRIMRRENYMIALINKDILDLSIGSLMDEKSVLTKTLEWNLKLCIDNFIYNKQGQINNNILKEYNRNQLAKELTSRFKLAAIINLILSPFIVIYFILLYFFKYFNEYKTNPSSIIGLRQYTPYAEWKLREFNELPHFFNKRLQMSINPAQTYIDQFPKSYLVINSMKLVNFISGSILAVLVIMGILLEDENHSFWSFEITSSKSTLFYISIFGTLWAITSTSTTPNDQNSKTSFVYDPEASLRYVAQFTHYLPSSWNKKLHTTHIKNEFCKLYSLKILVIVNEILSLIVTPFLLWFKISQSSGLIIDFFREYSIHVDGLGYVCYFAMFNFEEKDKNMMLDLNKKKKKKTKRKDVKSDSDSDESDEDLNYLSFHQDDKMIKSYMYFLESYGGSKQEQPKPSQSQPRKPRFTNDQQSISDSIYNVDYKFDDSDFLIDDKSRKKGGVLGMLNQFYNQDLNNS
ncbi:unnamed protein product [Candida verbasci]|uniref:Autophagy-related protein 9 n=1 Tax=Candida verbasci TaxID=1227364 RepID=A0A9W4XAQ0_9ASCO|nr:unnamed protein product [Candida verbasci]